MILLDLADHLTGALTALSGQLHHLPLGAPGHPTPSNGPLPGVVDDKLGAIMGWALRLGYVAAFIGFVIAGVKLFNGYRHGGGEEINFKSLGLVAAGCLVIGSAGAITDFLIS